MVTLSERFEAAESDTIEVDGRQVRQLYRRKVAEGTRIEVELRPESNRKVQALNMDADGGGELIIADTSMTRTVVRADTAPDLVEVLVSGGSIELTVYNAWVGEYDGLHAWIGDSGMLVEEDGDQVTLRCSDGDGSVSFDDLVVALRFHEP